MRFYPRFIEPRVIELLATTSVVIIEGARAVGKTSLVSKLHADGVISAVYSMADDETRKIVESDPVGWLRARTWPCAIDEAQLVPTLPLAIKQVMDETGDKISLILTGSASIGQTGLGGTDPLARRSMRISLEPLSEAEISAGQHEKTLPWSAIDYLYEATPLEGDNHFKSESSQEILVRGGMPKYRVAIKNTDSRVFNRQLEQDTKSVLTQQVLPGQSFDQVRASEILSYVLRHPASQLSVSKISQELEMHRSTVDNYLDALERRFLLYEVPNFHRPTRKSARSSAKFFPADIALSSHALMVKGDKNLADSETRGRLVEAHIVQQVRAHAGWAALEVELFHWRQQVKGRTAEVDIILQDSKGRLIALEVKSSSAFKTDYLKGIKDFREMYPDDFHRGFIVLDIPRTIRISEDTWAIPINSLYSQDNWLSHYLVQEDEAPTPMADDKEPVMKDAQIFMSYVHADADSAVSGGMREFMHDIEDALEGLYGREVEVFLDTDKAQWGENLWDRLDAELRRSTFFIPFITPRYLKSESCRREFTTFLEAAERAGVEKQLLLPLIWVYPPLLRKEGVNDVVTSRIKNMLYKDVSHVRSLNRGSGEYRQTVEDLAGSINERIEEREQLGESREPSLSNAESNDGRGAIEYLAEIQESFPAVQKRVEDFMESFGELSQQLEESSSKLDQRSMINPIQAQRFLLQMARSLSPAANDTESKAAIAAQKWAEFFHLLNRGVGMLSEASGEKAPDDLIESIVNLRNTLVNLEGMDDVERVAHQMPLLFSGLKPISRAFLESVKTIRSMVTAMTNWLEAVGAE
ncbi:DUF4143 domain-containing protein [Rothia nasimurium]|uniref:DUF4143 domain-containing protein n=1 Tax=Rothia nasimurium TaxID=85336 RepID=UPI002DD62994|nr:DUF4143 domain-containing protein [Rothia nasimurium]